MVPPWPPYSLGQVMPTQFFLPNLGHIFAAISNISGLDSSSGPGSMPRKPGGSSLSRKSPTSFRKASSSAVYRKSIALLSAVPATCPVLGLLSHAGSQHHQSTAPPPSPSGSTAPDHDPWLTRW